MEQTKRLQRLVHHNTRLAKELADANRRIARLRFERGILLDRLADLEGHQGNRDLASDEDHDQWWRDIDLSVIINRAKSKNATAHGASPPTGSKRRHDNTDSELSMTEEGPSQADYMFEFDPPSQSGMLGSPKKRKTNKASATDVVLKTLPVEYNADGRPVLPLTVGVVTVLDLGTIVWDRPAYHNRRYILPVGFHSTRSYLSTVDANASAVYHSRILDGGPAPLFQITAEDASDAVWTAPTSTGAWSAVVRQANQLRNRDYSNSASGPDYYGLSNATVAMLIEELPGSERCVNYQRKRFERGAVHKQPKIVFEQPIMASTEGDQSERDDLSAASALAHL